MAANLPSICASWKRVARVLAVLDWGGGAGERIEGLNGVWFKEGVRRWRRSGWGTTLDQPARVAQYER